MIQTFRDVCPVQTEEEKAQECIWARTVGSCGVCHMTAQWIESFGFRDEVNLHEKRFGFKRLDLSDKAVEIAVLHSIQQSGRTLLTSIRNHASLPSRVCGVQGG